MSRTNPAEKATNIPRQEESIAKGMGEPESYSSVSRGDRMCAYLARGEEDSPRSGAGKAEWAAWRERMNSTYEQLCTQRSGWGRTKHDAVRMALIAERQHTSYDPDVADDVARAVENIEHGGLATLHETPYGVILIDHG